MVESILGTQPINTPKGTIGDFTILKTINYGGFGVVKLVRSPEGKEYAMKVLEPPMLSKDRILAETQ